MLSVKAALTLALITLTIAVASAGTWRTMKTYSGSTIITNDGSSITRRWMANGENGDYEQAVLAGHTGRCTSSGTITIKLTWAGVPDNTADPAPPKLWLYVRTVASASGDPGMMSADDGFHDPAVDDGSGKRIVSQPPGKGKLKSFDSSGGTVTVTATLTATGQASTPTNAPSGQGHTFGAGCGFDVSIHAQPYGLYQTSVDPKTNGDLDVTYNWKSTSGNKADIDPTVVTMYELVTYPGGSPYQPPAPFIDLITNPTKHSWSPRASNVLDVHFVPKIEYPYVVGTYTGTQYYYFDDTDTGETKVELRGPMSIVRNVISTLAGWYYKITKDGEANSVKLPDAY